MRRIACAAPALSLAACSGPLSAIDPAGPAAASIAGLWWVMLAGAGAIFALVMTLLLIAMRRGRSGERARSPGLWLGGLGLAFPSAVLLALLVYALATGERLQAVSGSDVVRVAAEGHRFFWRFRQADGSVGDHILHIPAGRPVDVAIRSADVIHSFWVPRLGGKMDAIPGKTNILRLRADAAGVYAGVCAEYCGVGHARNRFRVVAHDAAGWAGRERRSHR